MAEEMPYVTEQVIDETRAALLVEQLGSLSQTTVAFKVYRRMISSGGAGPWRHQETFSSEEEALEWINSPSRSLLMWDTWEHLIFKVTSSQALARSVLIVKQRRSP